MSYSEYLPHPALRKYIEAYWTLNLDQHGDQVTQRILPDGCADLIFNRGNTIYGPEKQKLLSAQESYLVGTMTTFKDVIGNPGSSTLGIRFRAGGMAVFYPLNQDELTDLTVPYQDKTLEDLIWAGKDLLNAINHYFLQKMPAGPTPLSAIVEDIYAVKGQLRISELTHKYHMSERKLERLFKRDVGVTVKGFSRIIRFTHSLDLIRCGGPGKSLTQIACRAGYYDQAHLCNEIKAYTGLTPAQI